MDATLDLLRPALGILLPVSDKDGKLIANITDNQWKFQPAVGFDRNYTDRLIEVQDASGKVAMQAVDLGGGFYVAGTFRCHDGRTVYIAPHPDGRGGVIDFPFSGEPRFPFKTTMQVSK